MKEEIKVQNNKPIQIAFNVKFMNLRKPVNIFVWCKDEYAITTMDNISVLKRLVEVEQQCGSKIKLLKDNGRYVAVQRYKNKTKEEIVEKVRSEIKKGSGGNFTEK